MTTHTSAAALDNSPPNSSAPFLQFIILSATARTRICSLKVNYLPQIEVRNSHRIFRLRSSKPCRLHTGDSFQRQKSHEAVRCDVETTKQQTAITTNPSRPIWQVEDRPVHPNLNRNRTGTRARLIRPRLPRFPPRAHLYRQ